MSLKRVLIGVFIVMGVISLLLATKQYELANLLMKTGAGVFTLLIIIMLIRLGVAGGVSDAQRKSQVPPQVKKVPSGPGKYQITGVDRATKHDTTWYCNADSAENAKVKAELEGIVATDVRRVGSK